MSRSSVALQVEIVCCAFYQVLTQQIFMLQKKKCRFYFCNMKLVMRRSGTAHATNNLNLQRNIVARQVARKCCSYHLAFKNQTSRLSDAL